MTKNKQFKYIIPLALAALMIMAVMPMNAIALSSYKINAANAIVNNNFNVQWDPSVPSTESVDINSGDIGYWDNKWSDSDNTYPNRQYWLGHHWSGIVSGHVNQGVYITRGQAYESTTSQQLYLGQNNDLYRWKDYSTENYLYDPGHSYTSTPSYATTYFG